MAFSDFTFPQVLHDLNLTMRDADLFAQTPPVNLRPEFLATLSEDTVLAVAIGTEKARSECIIAPLLLELRRLTERRFSLFSGVELDADAARGLNGVCDFLISTAGSQF